MLDKTEVFGHFWRSINGTLTWYGTEWKVSVFGVFLVHIFLHLDWIRRDTGYLFKFSPNAGKYGPKKLRIRTLLTQYWLKSKNYFHSKRRSLVLKKKFYLHYVFATSTLYLYIFTTCTLGFRLQLHHIYTSSTLYLHYIYTLSTLYLYSPLYLQ